MLWLKEVQHFYILLENNQKNVPWTSPLSIKSVQVFEATLGKLLSYSYNLKLVNGLPFLEMNPLLQKIGIENMLIAPLLCIFGITLYLLIVNFNTHITTQILQA